MRTTFARPGRLGAALAGRPGRDLTEAQRKRLPQGFDVVGEALASGASPEAACAVVGDSLARDGMSLGEGLSALRETYAVMGAGDPDVKVVEALSVAWGEATLGYFHEVSCEDPLTGMASAPHLRARLVELYREAESRGGSAGDEHALVVVDTTRHRTLSRSGGPLEAAFGRALTLAAVADAARTVFWGGETISRVGADRVVVLARRSGCLPQEVAVLRDACDEVAPDGVRVWMEQLPPRPHAALQQLSELARGG